MKPIPIYKKYAYLFLGFILVYANIDIFLPISSVIISTLDIDNSFTDNISTMYFLGLTISSLFFGMIADLISYKITMILGLIVFLISSFFLYFVRTANLSAFFRLLQGIGGGAITVLSPVLIFKSTSDENSIKAINLLNLTLTITLVLSPLIGVWINNVLGWKSIFLIIFILGLISLFSTIRYTKYDYNRNISKDHFKKYFSRLKEILKNPLFIQYLALNSFQYSILLLFIVLMPHFCETLFFLSVEDISLLQSGAMVSFLIGNISFHFILKKGINWGEKVATILALVSMTLLIIILLDANLLLLIVSFYLQIISLSMLLNISIFKRVKISADLIASNYAFGIFTRYLLSTFLITQIMNYGQSKFLFFILSIILLSSLSFVLLFSSNYIVSKKLKDI